MKSASEIERIVQNSVRFTPRTEPWILGLRSSLEFHFCDRHRVCPWRPGALEFDAYCHGRETGDTIARHEHQLVQMERAA